MPHSSANFRLKRNVGESGAAHRRAVIKFLPSPARAIQTWAAMVWAWRRSGCWVGSGGEVGVRVARLGKLGIDDGTASHALVTARMRRL